MQLQELGFFHSLGHDISSAAHTVSHTVVHVADMAAPDMKWAAGETWKGTQWCMSNAPCKAAAEKYGTEAVEAGMEAALLKQLRFFSHISQDISHAATTVEHGVVKGADAVEPIAKYAAGKAW
jgi:hypothetical protein